MDESDASSDQDSSATYEYYEMQDILPFKTEIDEDVTSQDLNEDAFGNLGDQYFGQEGREDVDVYEDFETDYEKYEYDQNRFSGLEKGKGPLKRVYYKKRMQPKAEGKDTMIKGPTKPRQRPRDNALMTSNNGIKIDFDRKGGLWFSYVREDLTENGSGTRIPLCGRYAQN